MFLYNTYDAFCLRKMALRNTLRNKAWVIAWHELTVLNDKENKIKLNILKLVLPKTLIFVEKSDTI